MRDPGTIHRLMPAGRLRDLPSSAPLTADVRSIPGIVDGIPVVDTHTAQESTEPGRWLPLAARRSVPFGMLQDRHTLSPLSFLVRAAADTVGTHRHPRHVHRFRGVPAAPPARHRIRVIALPLRAIPDERARLRHVAPVALHPSPRSFRVPEHGFMVAPFPRIGRTSHLPSSPAPRRAWTRSPPNRAANFARP